MKETSSLSRIEAASQVQIFLLKQKLFNSDSTLQCQSVVSDILSLAEYVVGQCAVLRKSLKKSKKSSSSHDSIGYKRTDPIHHYQNPVALQPFASPRTDPDPSGFDRILNRLLSPSRPTERVKSKCSVDENEEVVSIHDNHSTTRSHPVEFDLSTVNDVTDDDAICDVFGMLESVEDWSVFRSLIDFDDDVEIQLPINLNDSNSSYNVSVDLPIVYKQSNIKESIGDNSANNESICVANIQDISKETCDTKENSRYEISSVNSTEELSITSSQLNTTTNLLVTDDNQIIINDAASKLKDNTLERSLHLGPVSHHGLKNKNGNNQLNLPSFQRYRKSNFSTGFQTNKILPEHLKNLTDLRKVNLLMKCSMVSR